MFLCHQFHCKFVCFTLEADESATTHRSKINIGNNSNMPNAFVIMMSAAHKVTLPPSYQTSDEEQLRGDHAIYNKLMDLLKSMNLGWSPDNVKTTGEKFVKALSDCLWTLDPHHEQFSSRACVIPSIFAEFKGYNN